MIYFKKVNSNDVMNLVEGVVSEVYVTDDVRLDRNEKWLNVILRK